MSYEENELIEKFFEEYCEQVVYDEFRNLQLKEINEMIACIASSAGETNRSIDFIGEQLEKLNVNLIKLTKVISEKQ